MMLCSACLLGIRCRYDGSAKPDKKVIALSKKERLIPICPEQLGGLPIPREPSEIRGRSVLSRSGKDLSSKFSKGAKEALKIAKVFGIRKAIMKQKSPSCGCGKIYDGRFSGRLVKGDGITTQFLKKNGITVITEEDL
jgi:uncharacterized protein YbbK (DUF523 family)